MCFFSLEDILCRLTDGQLRTLHDTVEHDCEVRICGGEPIGNLFRSFQDEFVTSNESRFLG